MTQLERVRVAPNPRPTPRWLSYEDVAGHLGVSVRTVQRYVEQGSIPSPEYYGALARFPESYLFTLDERGVCLPGTYERGPSLRAKAKRSSLRKAKARERQKERAKAAKNGKPGTKGKAKGKGGAK